MKTILLTFLLSFMLLWLSALIGLIAPLMKFSWKVVVVWGLHGLLVIGCACGLLAVVECLNVLGILAVSAIVILTAYAAHKNRARAKRLIDLLELYF